MKTNRLSKMSIDTGLSIAEVEREYSSIDFDKETGKYFIASHKREKRKPLTRAELRWLTK